MEINKDWRGLCINDFIVINIIYGILYIVSIYFFLKFNKNICLINNTVLDTILLSAICLINGSVICYSRKIYLIAIRKGDFLNCKEKLTIKRIGLILYFIWKPIYSITYSIIIVFTIILFISGLSTNYNINNYQVYFIEVLSYIIGYNNGAFLDTFYDLYKNKKNII